MSGHNSGSGVAVMLGNPSGFDTASQSGLTIGVGDLDGDGDPDLAVPSLTAASVSVLLGLAGGDFGAATTYAAGMTPTGVAVGDFNVDGDPDLAVADAGSVVAAPATMTFELRRGSRMVRRFTATAKLGRNTLRLRAPAKPGRYALRLTARAASQDRDRPGPAHGEARLTGVRPLLGAPNRGLTPSGASSRGSRRYRRSGA